MQALVWTEALLKTNYIRAEDSGAAFMHIAETCISMARKADANEAKELSQKTLAAATMVSSS